VGPVPDREAGGATLASLVAEGVVDAELGALLWLLTEGGVPLVLGGGDAGLRSEVASAVLAVDSSRHWVLLDTARSSPSLEDLAALVRSGSGVGLSVVASDLAAILTALGQPPFGLPDDAVRRLGTVLVAARTDRGPRVIAAHYLRPTERDGGGHIQRRPPAVLATWEADLDAFEHYAWGVTPELGDRVGRAQADLEDRQRDRAAALMRAVADRATSTEAWAERVRAQLAIEPPRTLPPERPAAEPSRLRGGLFDPEPHGH
jgi:hypothetical protein